MDARQLIVELRKLIDLHGNREVLIDIGATSDLLTIDQVDLDAEDTGFILYMPEEFYHSPPAA